MKRLVSTSAITASKKLKTASKKSTWSVAALEWLNNPDNADQELQGKEAFLRSRKEGKASQLRVVGISNGVLRKKASSLSKDLGRKQPGEPMEDIIRGATELWTSGLLEAQFLSCVTLGFLKSRFAFDLFQEIDDKWIDLIDSWVSSDVLCMDVLTYFPLHEERYHKILLAWARSPNFWRRRVSLVARVKIVRKDASKIPQLLQVMDIVKEDESYYVKRGVRWMKREASRTSAGKAMIEKYYETK